MADYTPNYGLHQWVPEDQFLRADFNEDFSKIDAALKAAEDQTQSVRSQAQAWAQAAQQAATNRAVTAENNAKTWANAAQSAAQAAQSTADRALKDLEPVGYNVYNLLLRNDYEGKATEYKKALVFDGFRDQSGISSVTGAVWDAANKNLLLDGLGQQNVPEKTQNKAYAVSRNSSVSTSFTATGNGTLTRFALPLTGSASLTVKRGTTQLATGALIELDPQTQNPSVSLSVPVQAGQTYTFTVTNTTTSTIYLTSDHDGGFCYSLTFTPTKTTSGTMTGASQPVSGTFQRAKAWVRCTGGTPALSLLGSGGSWKSLTKGSTRTTVNADGLSCTETEFTLSASITGPVQAKLDLSVSSGTQMRVYDYGVIFL